MHTQTKRTEQILLTILQGFKKREGKNTVYLGETRFIYVTTFFLNDFSIIVIFVSVIINLLLFFMLESYTIVFD